MKMKKSLLLICLGLMAAAVLAFAGNAIAAAGHPLPGQLGLSEPATPVMERIYDFHNMLLYVCAGISAFVILLLAIIIVRFNAKANPVPARFAHNTLIEIIWTVVPVIILIVIAVPSLKLIYYMDRTHEPEMTLKVTGYQWYWGYEYPDHDGINFFSYMIPDKDIDPAKGQIRLLSTDAPVVVPVDTNIQVLVTAGADDVLHSFAVPAFGIKQDAVPGRTNETWFRVTAPGTYYGQCSELCGRNHAFMPIEIKAVSKAEFEQWVEMARKEYASSYTEEAPVALARTEEVK